MATVAEAKFKDILRNEGKLFSGKHGNKKSRDTELIIVRSQEDYAEYVDNAQKIIAGIEDSIRKDLDSLEIWKEKTKIIDTLCKQAESMMRHAESVTAALQEKIDRPRVNK